MQVCGCAKRLVFSLKNIVPVLLLGTDGRRWWGDKGTWSIGCLEIWDQKLRDFVQLECRIHGLEGNSRDKNRKTLHNLGSF